jgi:hypothetical protein
MKAQGISKFPSLIELEELLGFPEALYFHIRGEQRVAKWITIANRILTYDGIVRDKIVRVVEYIRAAVYLPQNATTNFGRHPLAGLAPRTISKGTRSSTSGLPLVVLPEPKPRLLTADPSRRQRHGNDRSLKPTAPRPEILVSIRERVLKGTGAWVAGARNRGVDERFKAALVEQLPISLAKANVGGRPKSEDQQWRNFTAGGRENRPVQIQTEAAVKSFAQLHFRDQMTFMAQYNFFVADEGAHLSWMALTNPGSTWVTIYDYNPGLWTPNLRYHVRTWLLNRNSRFVAYVITDGQEAGLEALLREACRAPFRAEIVVVTFDGLTRCWDLDSCANVLDYSLMVDMRGMNPMGV